MKYFAVRENIDKVYARQIGGLVGYDLDAPNAQGALSYYELPNFEPSFSKLYSPPIVNGITDLLSDRGAIGGKGFIMTDKLKKFFEEFKLGKGLHRFYPLNSYDCESGNSLTDVHYHYLQLVDIQKNHNYIIYPKSSFFLRESEIKMDKTPIAISTKEEFYKLYYDNDATICYDKLVIGNGFEKLDLFYLANLADVWFSYVIMSERLLNQLKKIGLLDNLFEYKEVPIFIE